MINFDFNISNPFSSRWGTLFVSSKKITTHKAIEANLYKTNAIVSINLRISIKGDHAGIQLTGGLLGYEVELHFYDTRHWDYENNCWTTYDR
jgi:hypothetical protein